MYSNSNSNRDISNEYLAGKQKAEIEKQNGYPTYNSYVPTKYESNNKPYIPITRQSNNKIIPLVNDADIISVGNIKYLHNKINNAIYLYTSCIDFINRYRGINMNKSGSRVIMSDGHWDGSKIINDRVKSPLDLNTCKILLEIVNKNNNLLDNLVEEVKQDININLLVKEEEDKEEELTIQEAVKKVLIKKNITTMEDLDNLCGSGRNYLYNAVQQLAPKHWSQHNTPKETVRATYESLLLGYKCVNIDKHNSLVKDINSYNTNNNNNNNNNNLFLEEENEEEELIINTTNNNNNITNNKVVIPQENINLCIVGTVSAGKSTILNAFFCEQLSQCKIKRTTMVPTVYIENDNFWNPFDQTEEIFKTISEKNQEIISLTENGHKLKKEEYQELVFNVGKLDINILPDSFVNVYDIPGLNDARTKDVYYEYLDENFYKFNLVIFLVDIHSGLNTSDEMEIVNFITNRTRDQLENNNRKIYTLVVVNKADDMQLNEDDSTDKLELTGELSEMYEQVEKTLTDEFKRKNVSDHLIGIIPMCAIDAYLYRMVKKHGREFKLSPEQILKIGVNENGKKFSTLKPATQEKKVYEILNDQTFIDTMIKLSGFSSLEKILAKFLSENDKGKQIRIDNLLYDLRKLPSLTSVANMSKPWFNIIAFEGSVKNYCKIYDSIKQIDINNYNEHIINMVEEIEKLLAEKVTNWSGSKEELLRLYDLFVNKIMNMYLESYVNTNDYPTYLTNKIIKMIEDEFDESLTITDITNNFELLVKINMFNKSTITKLLQQIIINDRAEKTINFADGQHNTNIIIPLLDEFKKLDVDLSRFLRFLIINQLYSHNYYGAGLLSIKTMLYQKYGEIPISNLLKSKFSDNYKCTDVPFHIFVDGLTPEVMLMDQLKLDIYYLSYEKELTNTLNLIN